MSRGPEAAIAAPVPNPKESRTMIRCLMLALFLTLNLGSALAHAAPASKPEAVVSSRPRMTLQDGNLTAEIVGVPLRQVMEEIGGLTEAEVRWLGAPGEARVSVAFSALPVAEAIGRVLGTRSFMLVASAGDVPPRVRRILILAGREGLPPPEARTALSDEMYQLAREAPEPDDGDARAIWPPPDEAVSEIEVENDAEENADVPPSEAQGDRGSFRRHSKRHALAERAKGPRRHWQPPPQTRPDAS
jgi:hypothetical protein